MCFHWPKNHARQVRPIFCSRSRVNDDVYLDRPCPTYSTLFTLPWDRLLYWYMFVAAAKA